MSWLTRILAVLKFAPQILQLIAELDTTITGQNQGPARKTILMSTVAGAPQEVQDSISKLVDDTVAARKTAAATQGGK